ncbi:MAG: hypothetical protein ABI840_04340, partial [bacterium]
MNFKNKLSPVNIFLLLLILFFITGYIAYPLISLVKESFAVFESNSSNSFFDISSDTILNSVLLSIITVIGSCILGVFIAYK